MCLGNYQGLGLINSSVPHFFFMDALDTNLHIGRLIDQTLKASGMTYAQFARLLHCDRTTVYHLVRSKSIDTDRLLRISKILNHDFLRHYYPNCTDGKITVEIPSNKLLQLADKAITSITIEIKTTKKEK